MANMYPFDANRSTTLVAADIGWPKKRFLYQNGYGILNAIWPLSTERR